jgi:hypothetical protein
VNQAKLVKGHQQEKEAINKLLTLVQRRKKKCMKRCIAAMETGHAARRRRAYVL